MKKSAFELNKRIDCLMSRHKIGRAFKNSLTKKILPQFVLKSEFCFITNLKGQNEMVNCNSRKINQFSYANINNKRSHFASFSWILITEGFFYYFLLFSTAFCRPKKHKVLYQDIYLTDVNDFLLPMLFINIIA